MEILIPVSAVHPPRTHLPTRPGGEMAPPHLHNRNCSSSGAFPSSHAPGVPMPIASDTTPQCQYPSNTLPPCVTPRNDSSRALPGHHGNIHIKIPVPVYPRCGIDLMVSPGQGPHLLHGNNHVMGDSPQSNYGNKMFTTYPHEECPAEEVHQQGIRGCNHGLHRIQGNQYEIMTQGAWSGRRLSNHEVFHRTQSWATREGQISTTDLSSGLNLQSPHRDVISKGRI